MTLKTLLRLSALLAVATVLMAAAVGLSTERALARRQTMTTACSVAPNSASSGQTITSGNVALILPTGYDYVWGPANVSPPPGSGQLGGSVINICVVQLSSTIQISDQTGRELGRTGTDSNAKAVLDQIASSVRVVGTTTPPLPPRLPLSPPSTGDAGLLSNVALPLP